MNKTVKVVIGANYGDEGKGLMTDYFCRKFPSDELVLNVRFNGGAQAGHTVVSQDGHRHVFSHFGSGSFNENVTTYLDSHFILNPMLFRKEWDGLVSNGVNVKNPLIKSKCRISLPMDMMVNQFVEQARGDGRHGSCGVGINETVERNCVDNSRTVISDFIGMSADEIFSDIKSNSDVWKYFEHRIFSLGLVLSEEQRKWFYSENILFKYASDLAFMLEHLTCIDGYKELFSQYDNFVFEGAQGLLLDTDRGVHTTPSHTGLEYVAPLFLSSNPHCEIEVCYVSRTYFTRHGAGPFRTECLKENINPNMEDKTNVTNEFQGGFRYGYFSIPEIITVLDKQHILCDAIKLSGHNVKETLAFTHTNETNSMVPVSDGLIIPVSKMKEVIGVNIGYLSDSEQSVNII